MKKDLILVIFKTYKQSEWYFEEKILPLMPYLNKKNNFIYESDTYILKLCSISNPDNLRGYNADLIYLSDECTIKLYNEIIIPIVGFKHDKIKVVM